MMQISVVNINCGKLNSVASTGFIKSAPTIMAGQHRVPTHLLTKKSRTFPGPPLEIFQDLFGAHKCLNIKKNPSLCSHPVLPPLPFPEK